MEQRADGYIIMPAFFPGAFDDFVDLVVPELQKRGLFRNDYTEPRFSSISEFAVRTPQANAGSQIIDCPRLDIRGPRQNQRNVTTARPIAAERPTI